MRYKHFFWQKPIRHWLTAPFIYSVFIPFVLLDIVAELYHRVSFPVYGIPYVKRSHYIVFDRHKLEYLSYFERFNCAYCCYANGLLAYVSKISAETEKYFCSIKHAHHEGYTELPHHKEFMPHGDEKAYHAYTKDGK